MVCRHGIRLERRGDRFFHRDEEGKECAPSQDETFGRCERLIQALRHSHRLDESREPVQ